MTTRSSSIGSPNSGEYYSFSQANGADGKYETVNGQLRLKWNSYTATFIREKRKMSSGSQWMPCFCNLRDANTIFSSSDNVMLQNRLAQKIKGHEFNLAVALAEGRKTSDMAVNALRSIGGALSDLRKGRIQKALRRLGVNQGKKQLNHKDLAGRWLELQYGWLPLLKDVYESQKAFELLTRGPRRLRFSASISKKGTFDSSCAPPLYIGDASYVATRRITYEMTEDLSTYRSLGLTDPLSVAWELLPYSFVIDWFIPIGTYLENLNVIPKLNGRYFMTSLVRTNWRARPNSFAYRNGTCLGSHVHLTRTAGASLTLAKPEVIPLPDAMSPKRIWNSIALAAQRIR